MAAPVLSGDTTHITWSITSGNEAGLFAINSSTGAITIADSSQFHYPTTASYSLAVVETDDTTNADHTVNVDVTHINQAPSITQAAPAAITDHNAVTLNCSYADADGGSGSETVTVNDTIGTLAAIASGAAVVTPSNSNHTLTITGTASDINATLHTLSYTVPGGIATSGTDTVTLDASDNGHSGTSGGTQTAVQKTIAITYTANDTPLVSGSAQSASDTGQHAVSGVAVTDAAGGTYKVTVSTSNAAGNIHLDSIVPTDSTTNDSATVTFTGTKDAINTALGTLKYTPGAYGTDTITIAVNDGGTALVGGAKTGQANITYTAMANVVPPNINPNTGGKGDSSNNSHSNGSRGTGDSEINHTFIHADNGPTLPILGSGLSSQGQVPLAPILSAPNDGGFRVVVADSSRGGPDSVVVARPIGTIELSEGRVSFTVPADAFAVARADASVTLSATQADGRPLPSWLTFNARSGTFVGTPPPGDKVVSIKVVARDNTGHEAAQVFKINVEHSGGGQRSGDATPHGGGNRFVQAGRPGLAAQLHAARHGGPARMAAMVQAARLAGRG
ncbi:MAG TPA: putative Ig domain-containing protein, partial [Magnetospirillum sp.]|nr:putative Ig domain-containing protein [Magnetospirillum sp.]